MSHSRCPLLRSVALARPGTIPEIGQLAKLRKLLLGNNRLTGAIPESIGQLPSLLKLNLSLNYLTGFEALPMTDAQFQLLDAHLLQADLTQLQTPDTTAVLESYLGNREEALAMLEGLSRVVGIKDSIVTTFADAKTRTTRLCEAAAYASNLIRALTRAAGELQIKLQGRDRQLLSHALRLVKQAVQEAEALVQELTNCSRNQWRALADNFRVKITVTTEHVSTLHGL